MLCPLGTTHTETSTRARISFFLRESWKRGGIKPCTAAEAAREEGRESRPVDREGMAYVYTHSWKLSHE